MSETQYYKIDLLTQDEIVVLVVALEARMSHIRENLADQVRDEGRAYWQERMDQCVALWSKVRTAEAI